MCTQREPAGTWSLCALILLFWYYYYYYDDVVHAGCFARFDQTKKDIPLYFISVLVVLKVHCPFSFSEMQDFILFSF